MRTDFCQEMSPAHVEQALNRLPAAPARREASPRALALYAREWSRLPPRGSRRQAVQRLFDMCWRHFLTEIGAPEHSDTLVLYPGFWTPPNPLAPWSCTVESSKQDGSSLCDGEKEI